MCQRLGIMGKSFHSLRHAAATEKHKGTDKAALTAKLASVLSLAEIKQLLGHASAKTTKKYVH
jgi:integrase